MTTEPTEMPSLADATGVNPLPENADATPPASDQPPAAKPELKDGEDLLFAPKKEGDAQPPKEGEGDAKPDDKGEGKDDNADDKSADAPIEYKFEIPENMPAPPEALEAFTKFAQENKMPPEKAQEALNMHIEMMGRFNESIVENWENTKQAWRQEVVDDPKLGGQNLDKTIAASNTVIDTFVSDAEHLKELQQDLTGLGLGNKRSFIKFLTNIHAKISDDSVAGTFGVQPAEKKSLASTLWPDMPA